jgi:hypothetical protein
VITRSANGEGGKQTLCTFPRAHEAIEIVALIPGGRRITNARM